MSNVKSVVYFAADKGFDGLYGLHPQVSKLSPCLPHDIEHFKSMGYDVHVVFSRYIPEDMRGAMYNILNDLGVNLPPSHFVYDKPLKAYNDPLWINNAFYTLSEVA